MEEPKKPRKFKVERRCKGHLTDGSGRRCKLQAIKGGTVCHKHGGGAPQVKASARNRLDAMVEPALAALTRVLEKAERSGDAMVFHPTVIRVSQLVLDRAGYGPTTKIEIEQNARQEVEAQGEMMAQVLLGAARELGIDVGATAVREAVRRQLEQLRPEDAVN